MRVPYRASTGLVLLLSAVVLLVPRADTQTAQQVSEADIAKAFRTFHEKCKSSSGTPSDLTDLADLIKRASAWQVAQTLTLIMSALHSLHEESQVCAESALADIAFRPDGGLLLSEHIDQVAKALESPYPRAQRGAVGILMYMQPAPPPEAHQLLLQFLGKTDRDTLAQASVIFHLVRRIPDDPLLIDETVTFLARPLDKQSRTGVLNSLGTPVLKNPRIVDAVLDSLKSKDDEIRATTISALNRMSKEALVRAKPALQRLAASAGEKPEVKEAAEKALRSVAQETN